MGLYEQIRDIAKNKGISVNKLEKELGFPRSSISKYNRNKPSSDKIQKISEFLGVSVDYLISGKENDTEGNFYLMDDEIKELVHDVSINEDLKLLLEIGKKMTPEQLSTHIEFLKKLYD